MRTYRDQAIVLRTYKLGEADRIVVLYGQTGGQIRAVAKGVRRTSSRFGARLAPFNLVDVQLHRGRGLDTITQVEALAAYSAPLGADYDAFTGAKVVAETMQKLTEGMGHTEEGYFPLLHGVLGALAARRHPVSLCTASFLFRIMKESGWEPALGQCAQCGGSDAVHMFAPESGGAVCEDCAPGSSVQVSNAGMRQVGALLRGDWQEAESLPRSSWDEAGNLAGLWTQWHLEQRLRSLPFLSERREVS